MANSVDSLRQKLRRRRRALGLHYQYRASKRLLTIFQNLDNFQSCRRLAFYWPNDGELDCRPLIRLSWTLGKRCYLPVLSQGELGPCLNFAPYIPGSTLKKNRYGIPEPVTPYLRQAHLIDMILVPLVGYDRDGNRLGMGGGYYDRTLALLGDAVGPLFVGIAHRHQRVNNLPVQSWDIPMDMIIAV